MARLFNPYVPQDPGTPPKYFGKWYTGSSAYRKAAIRRKHNAKYNPKNK